MIWRLLITAGAERDLNRIPELDRKRIKDELHALADEPHPKPQSLFKIDAINLRLVMCKRITSQFVFISKIHPFRISVEMQPF
jgi:mRNA-degrading endonuclease RelE of RelBE toxin-antitoxin system